ncbi:PaeR7I family type II restriction endonuclease [Streptomyces prasinus]|uniref:PaeR7I family type II restriction endonuclease n=1 Tax=Streptomyces prasinus TaxID=67345 RepID=UPI0006EB33FC|nr:PaeR7I family type II restriction endonuclease [Streptomyces prasinus]
MGLLHGKSYQERFGIFCERLVEEQLYDAACFITSSAEDPMPKELFPKLDWQHFADAIAGRITYLQGLGMPKTQLDPGGDLRALY